MTLVPMLSFWHAENMALILLSDVFVVRATRMVRNHVRESLGQRPPYSVNSQLL